MSQKELGRIGQHRYGLHGHASVFMEEFIPQLQGLNGIRVYTEMADNDATVGAVLFAIENLMRNADFSVEPGGESAKDKEAAEFIESCMADMEETWQEFLSECLSFITYGWSYHEIVYKRRVGKTSSPITNSKYSDGLIGWRKLPIRAQDTLYGWEYKDKTDDLIGMTQDPPPDFERVTIPIEKALHFKTRSRKGNPEGRSILRTAYRAWYFKKRLEEIEGYGMERDLAGFPVLYGPPNLWDDDDEDMMNARAEADRIISGIRRDALEGLALPGQQSDGTYLWKLELLASSGKRQFDTNAIIDRYDKRIATSVLADFVMLGQQQVGSFALADSKTKIFSLSIGSYLEVICEVFNNQAIPRLIDMNGDHFKGITDYPKMKHGDIDEQDIQQFATAVSTLIGAGALVPDEEMEKEIRRVLNLPEKVETAPPVQAQPGEGDPATQGAAGQQTGGQHSKDLYQVTSIMDKYQSGKITREAAAKLFMENGMGPDRAEFYLTEADKSRAEREKKEQEKAVQNPGKASQGRRNRKQVETPVDDEEDAQKAEEAKKSLGRGGSKS